MEHIEVVVLHECADFWQETLQRLGVLLVERRTDHYACHYEHCQLGVPGRQESRQSILA